MRAPIYLVCAALAVAVQSEENQNYLGLESVNVAADPETINYLLPKLAAKYRPSNEWRGVTDPRFYVLTEMESDDIENQRQKPKRLRNKRYDYRPTLSVQAPIQALRNLYDRSNYQQKILQNRQLINQLTAS
ncbi:uncharacterized protein Dh44 isoform X2 [Euwallacea fornicatus]|uniref:uncharacterized protein Dh44 isoform X2 n=1 Tax=Euwallacea fornicatus TaxID=995702 RepID=UPI00338D6820